MESLATPERSQRSDWSGQPRLARVYVAVVIALGAACVVLFIPRALPRPGLFAFTLLAACLTSAWKVVLPVPSPAASTLSVSYAAGMMALVLLGPELAIVIAVVSAWVQCTVNLKIGRQPLHRTLFSMTAGAVTMAVTGITYQALGGTVVSSELVTVSALVKPVAGAIATQFCVNSGLMAGAIALASGQGAWAVWRDGFLWSAASFMVSGAAGAAAAIVIAGGHYWTALLLLAPVYVVYWTYGIFVGRLADQKHHLEDATQPKQTNANVLPQAYVFGPYRLELRKRRLWKRDQLVALTPKAMDTLLTLVRQAGQVVDRDDLLRTVWPDTFVSEETLTQNIATIRRALGDSSERPDYIATVPRRGYQFIGVVTPEFEESTSSVEITHHRARRASRDRALSP